MVDLEMAGFEKTGHSSVRPRPQRKGGDVARDWEADEIALVADALASPVRRFVLELLVVGGATAGDLSASISDNFGVSTARASQHLGVLARARLVDVTVEAQWRWYSLAPRAAQPLINWLRALEASY